MAGEFPPAGAEMQAKILLKPNDERVTVLDAFGSGERLDNAFAESPCNGPWHAIVRIRANFEAVCDAQADGGDSHDDDDDDDDQETGTQQWCVDGSGFITDLCAPTAGSSRGDGRSLSVILTAGHVLCSRGKLAKRVTVFSADGRKLAESCAESRHSLRCAHAVCRDFTAAGSDPEYWYDYGAVFVDLGPCFFPNALHVDTALSVTQLCDCRNSVAAVAGYPTEHKKRPNEELVLGTGNFFIPGIPKTVEESSTAAGPTSVRAPLTSYTCNTSAGQSGGPVYFFDPINRGRSKWQAVGIHMTSSPHCRSLFMNAEHTSLDNPTDPARPPLLDIRAVIGKLYEQPIQEAGAFQECFNIGAALVSSVVADILRWPIDREEELRR